MMADEAPPPVRLSVDDINDGKIAWHDARRIDVLLDGVVQEKVVEYDCEAGMVTRLSVDGAGNPFATPDGQSVARESHRGIVTVRWGAE